MLLVLYILFYILTDNYFKLNHLVRIRVSFSF